MDRQMPQSVEIAQKTETHDWQLLSGNGWKLLETGLETSFWKRGNLSLDLCNILIFLWKLLWKQHAFQNAQVIEFVKESTCQSCCQPKEVSREKVVQVAEFNANRVVSSFVSRAGFNRWQDIDYTSTNQLSREPSY